MSSKIYKYMGYELSKLAFSEEGFCSFRCSYPNEFNDPYELFLTIDFQQQPTEVLAYYQEIIGKLPQFPVTCFSKAPDVIPMWAHYGHNHRGVVLEFDEQEFLSTFPEANFGDVDYREDPGNRLEEMLGRAFHIGKPRYHFFLQRGVLEAAYYTKHSCWSYEQERRLIVTKDQVVETGEMLLLKFPVSCITALIVGNKATEETKTYVAEASTKIGVSYYEMKIGKTSAQPFFVDSGKNVFVFGEEGIERVNTVCNECKEPVPDEKETCSWCTIDDTHERNAAKQNPLRMLDRYGLLDDWYKSMRDVGKKK